MVHEVSRSEEVAERRRANSVDHAGLEVEEHRAWYVRAARGLVVKHVDAAELRVVAAAILAVATDAVLVHTHFYLEWESKVVLPLLPLELWVPCKARWVWAGVVIFASVTCSLQFAKASAATLPQQEKNDSADAQRERVNISGLMCTAASEP
jgi:hypothetical protein